MAAQATNTIMTSAAARKLLEATTRAEAAQDALLAAQSTAGLAEGRLEAAERRGAEPIEQAKRRSDLSTAMKALHQAEQEHRKAQTTLAEIQGQQVKRQHEQAASIAERAHAEHERAYVQPLAAAVMQVLALADAERAGRGKLQDQLARDFTTAGLASAYPGQFVSDVAALFGEDRYGRSELRSALEVYLADVRDAGYRV